MNEEENQKQDRLIIQNNIKHILSEEDILSDTSFSTKLYIIETFELEKAINKNGCPDIIYSATQSGFQ